MIFGLLCAIKSIECYKIHCVLYSPPLPQATIDCFLRDFACKTVLFSPKRLIQSPRRATVSKKFGCESGQICGQKIYAAVICFLKGSLLRKALLFKGYFYILLL